MGKSSVKEQQYGADVATNSLLRSVNILQTVYPCVNISLRKTDVRTANKNIRFTAKNTISIKYSKYYTKN